MPSTATAFPCDHCSRPLTYDDFVDLGLRPPDERETRDDYFDAELLDSLAHANCDASR
jgi:hypothetical protein